MDWFCNMGWDGDILNSGKRFEAQWKDSIPSNVFFYRFRDGTSSWGGSQENTRFQQSNMCDCMMHDGKLLYFMELKSHKGKSLPLSTIRQNQLDELVKANTYKNVRGMFVINFADEGRTFIINAGTIATFIFLNERKSIPIAWCEQYGHEIVGKKKKVNYAWDIGSWLLNIRQAIETYG